MFEIESTRVLDEKATSLIKEAEIFPSASDMLPEVFEGVDRGLKTLTNTGAGWGIRTPDLLITNQLLYQLS